MNACIVEIRAAEGGEDAKLLVITQTKIYKNLCSRNNLTFEPIESKHGMFMFRASGPNCESIFKDEPGGHRWQRIPPTERGGRVHTSSITVAVLPEPSDQEIKINPQDLQWAMCRGSGNGGQHKNVTNSAVQLTHVPTKISIRCESERSQLQNKESALSVLRAKLFEIKENKASKDINDQRKNQVGCGQRGDKRRTIRTQEGIVKDHITGKKWMYDNYVKGNW